MLEDKISSHIGKLIKLNTDSASAYQEFCRKYNISLIAIPSGFHNNGINNIAEINGVHS